MVIKMAIKNGHKKCSSKLSSKIVIKNCHQRLSSKIVIQNCHQNCHKKMSSIKCHQQVSQNAGNQKVGYWVTESLSEWQGHLLSCQVTAKNQIGKVAEGKIVSDMVKHRQMPHEMLQCLDCKKSEAYVF